MNMSKVLQTDHEMVIIIIGLFGIETKTIFSKLLSVIAFLHRCSYLLEAWIVC